MARTLSEYLFERFCDGQGIPYGRIPEANTKTPDYELFPASTPIVVEIKEIDPNKEELEAERVARERGVGPAIGHTPGDRLRLKIAASSKQIKARAQGRHPSLLVVFNEGREVPHLESYSVRVAMYGLEQVYLTVPRPGMGSPHFAGMGYGPKRKMTPTDNTSISAIGALIMNSNDDIRLLVYHNRYAKVPLPPALLAQYAIRQFQLEPDTPGGAAGWSEISTANAEA
jgi:hypothetical protein